MDTRSCSERQARGQVNVLADHTPVRSGTDDTVVPRSEREGKRAGKLVSGPQELAEALN